MMKTQTWSDTRFVSMLDSKTQGKIRRALCNAGVKGTELMHAMCSRISDLTDTIDIAQIMGYKGKCVTSEVRYYR